MENNINEIFNKIRNTSSKNGKIDILRENSDNDLLKKILLYTYDPTKNYYTTTYASPTVKSSELDINHVFEVLDSLVSRKVTGNSAKTLLTKIEGLLNEDDSVVLRGIIGRSQMLGIDEKSINKVFSNLIPSIGYCRCSLKLDTIKYPAIIETKLDGLFCNVVYENGILKFLTRNGTEFILKSLHDEILHTLQGVEGIGDVVLHGELLVSNLAGSVESRKIGNGLVNSILKKEQTLESLQKKIEGTEGTSKYSKISSEITSKMKEFEDTDHRLQIVLWDMLPLHEWESDYCGVNYINRFKTLEGLESSHVKIVESKIVNNVEEAQEFYAKQIGLGREGAVIKNLIAKWKNHTSPDMVKMKAERECELLVVGVQEGEKKYTGGLGGLLCESSDGVVKVTIGSGFSDEQRGFKRVDENDSSKGLKLIEGFDINSYIGKIVTGRFNELITSQSKDTWSLFLPRLISFRNDKTEADNFEYIQNL